MKNGISPSRRIWRFEITALDQDGPVMAAKAQRYLALGVQLVWVLWERSKTVDVWRRGSNQPVATLSLADSLDGEDILTGFTYPLARLFA